MSDSGLPRLPLQGRDWIALAATAALVLALVASAVWLHARQSADRDTKARQAAAAAQAAAPKRLPPITTSVYVRAVPVHHAQ